ncbi:MAG: type II toxin-antitoxin system VapC family toxin [Candidatus Uhrbacteria bacterium]|nr:type II toxin-antitoxin system VapC family toxin [Candidatus Uhrbacteria bacterium]
MYTLDTNAIIYYLKGDSQATVFFDTIIARNVPLYVSTITEVELFGFSALTNDEAESINQILTTVTIIPLDSRIARIAGSLRRQYHIKVPDSIIAATTLVTHTMLVTRNVKDFRKVEGIAFEKF